MYYFQGKGRFGNLEVNPL
jgi:hypothetical protein